MSSLLEQTSRLAFAALIHDLGKFAERARLEFPQDKLDGHKQTYCPQWPPATGPFTHIHAAYTGLAFDEIEPYLPRLRASGNVPFAHMDVQQADDALINAAARHHRPETFLQWIIAVADRVASGFERQKFEDYNRKEDLNHYTARLLTLLEQVRLEDTSRQPDDLVHRYPLRPLSVAALFPVARHDPQWGEGKDRSRAQTQYKLLWDQFVEGLKDIPKRHRANWPLWLDHFDTLWLTFTHAIPSTTVAGYKRDVSLYDHSKAVAALAVALWRWHKETGSETVEAVKGNWETSKFLLIQGDFFGIQDFIFASGGETQKKAAKLLRGRSFYVSLLSECAALKVLEVLELPSTSQIVNAAGKFLIVAANTKSTLQKLQGVRRELDAWFLTHTFGQSGIGIAWTAASCDDFRVGAKTFGLVMKRLFAELEKVKLSRFSLCGEAPAAPVFEDYLDRFDNRRGVCEIDGRSPAVTEQDGLNVATLSRDMLAIGDRLVKNARLLVTTEDITHHTLEVPLFGYWVSFTSSEDSTDRFGDLAGKGVLRRMWDFSPAQEEETPLWKGYARRAIAGYVPRFSETDLAPENLSRYAGMSQDDRSAEEPDAIKTLNHLAREDRVAMADDKGQRWIGVEALAVLKGDVDHLGAIFQGGIGDLTFAKMAGLSRQLHAFFAIYLPWLCGNHARNTYVVFAGGDDFFLLGPWRSQMKLASRMKQAFGRFVASNAQVHFSAGFNQIKPGQPIRALAQLGEESLAKAKEAGRNRIVCYDQIVEWRDWQRLMVAADALAALQTQYSGISTGYLYQLIRLSGMAASIYPEDSLWHAHFRYLTWRNVAERARADDDEDQGSRQREIFNQVCKILRDEGILLFKAAYKIPLFRVLYAQRD